MEEWIGVQQADCTSDADTTLVGRGEEGDELNGQALDLLINL